MRSDVTSELLRSCGFHTCPIQFSGSRKDGRKCSGDEDDDDDDECNVVPSFQSAFTDALMVADWNLNVENVYQGTVLFPRIPQLCSATIVAK